MIGHSNSRDQILAQLNASIDNFFSSGGSVETLPGFEYVPHRPHRDLEPKRSSIATPPNKRLAARLKQLDEIRELAKTMTYKEAMAHTGLAQATLVRAASQGNFKFQRDPNYGKSNLGKKLSDPVEDRSKAEKIIAYRNVGMSRADVVRELQISFKQLGRLCREFDIEFPTIVEKRAKRKA
ncbi:hypothetical protein NPS53_17160 [Pseudomonas putida]|uniref:Uncharacterized protein n=1 Tax=Pseudomonas sp. 13.2 TaxID=3144665 RepID=A0AAU7BIA1_9PSED|nr:MULTISPECIES: hypothetical protein [Pseudomonas]MDD2141317.1 hypothetical protein [Pseudomonas putida]HDS1723612.1 hypothetical protein [Pseudomonas putida]